MVHLRDEKLKVHLWRGARRNNAEKRENEKWPYHSYQWLFLCVGGGLRKGKRKRASQDRNGYLSRGLLGKKAPELRHRFCRMCGGQSGHDKRTSRVPSCPPEVLAFSSTFLSPAPPHPHPPRCRLKGAIHRPGSATKPRQRFLKQDVCLRPPSPQINNPQKPDLGRQSGSTPVTLFPHPVSWSTGGS